MAVCQWCHQEMTEKRGCTVDVYDDFPDGIARQRIPYGQETRFTEDEYWPPTGDRHCHDCGVGVGELHHPGCDMEECPKCGGQAIGCGCTDAEDE